MSIVKMSKPVLYPSIWDELFRDEPASNMKRFPAVNIKENEDAFTLEVIAPGLNRDMIDINITNDQLTISSEMEKNEEDYLRKEYSHTSFSRSFTLPESVESDNISAKYSEGVLYVNIPKREEAKPKPPRRIEIK